MASRESDMNPSITYKATDAIVPRLFPSGT